MSQPPDQRDGFSTEPGIPDHGSSHSNRRGRGGDFSNSESVDNSVSENECGNTINESGPIQPSVASQLDQDPSDAKPSTQPISKQSLAGTDSGAAVATDSASLPPTDIRKMDIATPIPSLQVPHSGGRIQVRNTVTTEKKDRSIIRGRLEALRDNGPEMTVYLDGPEVTIGRARDMDIVTLDDGISRAHAIFQRHEQGYRLRDCGSGNGTYLNGKSIDVAELYDDDIITLGRLQLRYHTIGWTRPRRRKKSAVALTLTETLAVETNRSPITNLVAGFLSAVVGVMIASLLSQNPQVDHKNSARHWYDQAKVSAQFEKWTEAAEELEIARVLGLKEQRYVPLAKSIQRAVVDQRVLEQLTQGMESGLSWFQVQKLADRINESSVYWPQRQLLLERLKRTFVERWSRAAYRSYMAGNTKKLKRLLGHIRDTDPNHATLTALTRYSQDHSK